LAFEWHELAFEWHELAFEWHELAFEWHELAFEWHELALEWHRYCLTNCSNVFLICVWNSLVGSFGWRKRGSWGRGGHMSSAALGLRVRTVRDSAVGVGVNSALQCGWGWA